MKCGRLFVALGACSLLLASAAAAEPAVHQKAAPAATAQKAHAPAKAERKAARSHNHKRAVEHDSSLDWPQLG